MTAWMASLGLCGALNSARSAAMKLTFLPSRNRFGQEPRIAALAARYLMFCVPCLFLSIAAECCRK